MSEENLNISINEVFQKPKINGNGLILYYHPLNFASQKILVVLNEKGLEFTSYIVDLTNGEQYSSWFLNINSKGEVPVLQDGSLIIPGSIQIINYLEVKYKNDSSKQLLQDLPTSEINKILYYQKIFNQIPVGAITLGSFIHDDLKLNSKPPFIGPFKKTFLENNERVAQLLKSSVDGTNSNVEILFKKIEFQNKRFEIVQNRNEFQKILDELQQILIYINNELKQNLNKKWLINNDITIADINLGILLYRLYILGFEDYFWKNNKLPLIEKYLDKFKNLESFKKSVPSHLDVIKELWLKAPSNYKIGAAGVMALAMFAAIAHSK